MGRTLRRARAVIRLFNPDQEYWYDTCIVVKGNRYVLETHWRNPELAGIWLWTHIVTNDCFRGLILRDLIVRDGRTESGEDIYRLSEKGKKRLM